MSEEHVTKQNPHGRVTKCDETAFHRPHEWLSYGGNYTLDYCPGKRAGKKTMEALNRLFVDAIMYYPEGSAGRQRCMEDAARVAKALGREPF